MKEQKKHPKGKGCWYKTHTWWCVLCMREEIVKWRMWTPKPDDWNKRNEITETVCGEHFV